MSYTIPVQALVIIAERTIEVPVKECRQGEDAAKIATSFIGNSPVEKLIAIMLDGRSRVTGVILIAQGGIHGTSVKPLDILRAVLVHQAPAFILAHNHPSGDPTPSYEDKVFTDKVLEATKSIGLALVDHVVVTPDGSFSCIPMEV